VLQVVIALQVDKGIYRVDKAFTIGKRVMSYFDEVVLPSVNLPKKTTYNIPEALIILDCTRPTLLRMHHLGHITITRDKKIYYKEFEKYFEQKYNPPISSLNKK